MVHGPAMLMTPPFRFLQFASYSFDACLVEILTTLMMGGTVCVPREEDRTNGNIAAVMEQMNVTMALLTPSFARVLNPADVPQLKTLVLGGEAMDQSHLAAWAERVNLVNAYGPSECAVVAAVHPHMRKSSNPGNLGRGLGRCWVVDPKNHHRLAPLGAIGELVVEGPALSMGYLNNREKTREVFVNNPRWTRDNALRYTDEPEAPRRMYKTGDLVRICDDVLGEMVYVGRKDSSQAKINGQRLELGDIAHHLGSDDAIQHAIVIIPNSGPCAKRLVAVISLRGSATEQVAHEFCRPELVMSSTASQLVAKIRDRLRQNLPSYMIPSTWLTLKCIPLVRSGKLDHAGISRFVESMSEETFDNIAKAISLSEDNCYSDEISERKIPVDMRLQVIWSQVLNLTPRNIGKNVSFLQLGGDSIAAMHVMAKCRTEGIIVSVRDIISSKSVHDLSLKASFANEQHGVKAPNEDQHEFDPTPIQQLYFELVENNSMSSANPHRQFNQSVLLRLDQKASSHQLRSGIHALVKTHSMLRARFRRDGMGNWRQRITSDISGSYRFKTHTVRSEARMEKRIINSQRTLNIQNGPLLSADLFSIGHEKRETYVFITAHHLVVDIVSWGILLQDLEDYFATGGIRPVTSLPFQAWGRRQSDLAQREKNGLALLPHHAASDVDTDYWGMAGKLNLHGDTISENIKIDGDTTAMLLRSEYHKPLDTDTLDVMLAALLLSYRNVTNGRRGAPTIYNEGHGREVWDDTVDISRTVGWFTTLYPVHLPDESGRGKLS